MHARDTIRVIKECDNESFSLVFSPIAFAAAAVALGAIGLLFGVFPFGLAAIIIAASLKMANTWEKFVILRAGKLRGVKGPNGLFLIIPVIDHVVGDQFGERIQTTAFSAEEALTKDTVPVNVDAIIFWFVHDAQKAALNITNYREAIDRVSQNIASRNDRVFDAVCAFLERNSATNFLRRNRRQNRRIGVFR